MLMHQVTEEELDVCYNVKVKGTFGVLKRLSNSFLNKVRVVMLSLLFLRLAWEGILISRFTTLHKGAQANPTRRLAIEYGRDKIRVNGICPLLQDFSDQSILR